MTDEEKFEEQLQIWEDHKQENWEKLKKELGLFEYRTSPVKKPFWTKGKIAAFAVTACAFIGLSLGISLYLPSLFADVPPPLAIPPQADQTRYCAQSEYTSTQVKTTLKEYSLKNGGSILYFDDYSLMEELYNATYTLNETNEIIAFQEQFFDIEQGVFINIYVTDTLTYLEDLNLIKDGCIMETTVHDINVNYYFYTDIGTIVWEYNGYRYYMEVEFIDSENSLFAIVSELLQT